MRPSGPFDPPVPRSYNRIPPNHGEDGMFSAPKCAKGLRISPMVRGDAEAKKDTEGACQDVCDGWSSFSIFSRCEGLQ